MNSTPDSSLSGQPTQEVSAEKMRLKVGDLLQMQLAGAVDTNHYPVHFIGALKGQSLLTTLPIVDGRAMWMKPGGRYIFRVLSGKHAFAFTTQLVCARAHPYPYAHFAYPGSVRERQIRGHRRITLKLPITLSGPDNGKQSATLLDLSLTGAQLEAENSLGEVGASLKLELPIALTEVDKRLTVAATIRNSRAETADSESPRVWHGVEFGQLDKDDMLLLHYFIDHNIVEEIG